MKTKVFTDDVIQRIASGNEIQQTKKISLNVIETVLNPYEMRNVLGGSETINGGELPGPTITCGQYWGACWKCIPDWNWGPTDCRIATGDPKDYCEAPLKCY